MTEPLEIAKKATASALDLAPTTTMTAETKLSDLGADSLDRIEIIMEIEEEIGTTFTDEECENVQTLNDLVALILKHAG